MHICLNLIVRNERANILRCLNSVAPFISSWVIGDTGSTDNTQEIILEFMRERQIGGELHEFEFKDFSQARNAALALTLGIDYDYVLLMDADMELRLDPGSAFYDVNPFDNLTEPYYSMLQEADGLSYWNARLVSRNAYAKYIGSTHEYLDTSVQPIKLETASFIDHMDGGSRSDKFQRDERLLLAELERDPNNTRTVYYLAKTYLGLGDLGKAANYFSQRASMGGWDEEQWHAEMSAARCLRELGEKEKFICGALKAFGMRPSRSEPLLDLANYYRLQGLNHLSAMFTKRGMDIPYPSSDILFIEPHAYHDGFKNELSVVGFYTGDKEEAASACEELATRLSASDGYRRQARWNLQFYTKPLEDMAQSFSPRRPTETRGAMNPSVVCTQGGRLLVNIRQVNYTIRPDGSYVMDPGCTTIETCNYLCELDPFSLEIIGSSLIQKPIDYPWPAYHEVIGFEDVRLFTTDDAFLHFIATVRDINGSGIATPIVGVIQPHVSGVGVDYRMTDWRILQRTFNAGHEKNWMPVNARHGDGIFVDAPYRVGSGRFVYSCGPKTVVLDRTAAVVQERAAILACENWRGGSQLIQWGDGWLCVVHEVDFFPGSGERSYQHRFVHFTQDFKVHSWSRRFYLQRRGIEFVAGLCWRPEPGRNDLVISWGANRDSEAWVGTISADDVDALLIYN